MNGEQSPTAAYSTAAFSDAVGRLFGRGQRQPRASTELKTVGAGKVRSGVAHTIRISSTPSASADQRARYFEAFDDVPAGVMLVIEVVDDVGGAVIGDVMATSLRHRGVSGVIVAGPIRDSDSISRLGLATWARTVTMHSMASDKVLTEVGVRLDCAGVAIVPGDLVVADSDGFISIPQAQSDQVVQDVERSLSTEEQTLEAIGNGAKLAEVYRP